MAELIDNCPRCNAAHVTFDLKGSKWISEKYNWQQWFEAYCVCRRCHRGTIFILALTNAGDKKIGRNDLAYDGALNDLFKVEGYVSYRDADIEPPPEHLPENIEAAFREGATCMSVKCFNAAGTMFRLCLDFATKALMPAEDVDGLNKQIRRSLGLRLNWLFDTKRLPEVLRDLSSCVKDDGNDGAHDGTLDEVAALDLQDFTRMLLERLYTEQARLEEAKARRAARHKS
ncbi:DUF4145 domain-containing protein [Caballeronia novacaledonica]|uniref:DUF4145 domain-containing protein n=1 Tax=Caballeronia novacaledonica TaxID=1544861 RepID=A0ACB5R4F3_9BURK|nr:DUF4145 domain-containing protein [Caballeronia novacaledonica]